MTRHDDNTIARNALAPVALLAWLMLVPVVVSLLVIRLTWSGDIETQLVFMAAVLLVSGLLWMATYLLLRRLRMRWQVQAVGESLARLEDEFPEFRWITIEAAAREALAGTAVEVATVQPISVVLETAAAYSSVRCLVRGGRRCVICLIYDDQWRVHSIEPVRWWTPIETRRPVVDTSYLRRKRRADD